LKHKQEKKLRQFKDKHTPIQPIETIESEIPLEMSKKKEISLLIKR
jgi:hypothetical protein